jgi:serine/threonine-protein kinase
MVVEFCGGGSLEDEYKKGPISVAKVRQIIADVCSGLSCIHNRGMVHRDIKPGNLLSSGSKWLIGDFGLVTADLAYGYASAQGYLDHLPTETHRDGITSIKSDVWALGMTIYRLLHGNDFYQEEYAHRDIPRLIMQGGFATRLLWLPHIPTDWRRFIRKSMHDLSEQRFRDMFHMSQAAGALSIKPDWKCNYATNLVRWTAQKGNRTLEVFWEVLSPNKHRWFARSSGGIRGRAIGGSKGIVSKRQATVELERFFQPHA